MGGACSLVAARDGVAAQGCGAAHSNDHHNHHRHARVSAHPAAAPPPTSSPSQWSLQYVNEDGSRNSVLADAFSAQHALQHVVLLRLMTVVIVVINLLLLLYDRNRFEPEDPSAFKTVMLLRVVVVVPVCLGIIMFSYSAVGAG